VRFEIFHSHRQSALVGSATKTANNLLQQRQYVNYPRLI
jgi:hypothetical protein